MFTILTYGAPELIQKAVALENINGDTAEFVEQMFETMKTGRGIGLAGPQVGRLERLFVCHVTDEDPMVFINPEILETSVEELSYEEGCLSLPGVWGDVIRPRTVTVQAFNLNGKPFTLQADGMLARVILHEFDHLNGVLFPDRMPKKRRDKVLELYEKKMRA